MSQSSEQVMEALSKLPPFSPVLTKLMASLAKEDVMVNELADWIEKDTVLTGNVLRMVNSAAYGRMGTISSVRHAIAILGTNRLRNIVMGLSVCNMMTNVKLPAAWSAKAFNRHSIAVATMADLIVQEVDVNYPEGAFVAGLLHDVGKLLLAVSAPGEYADILQGSRESGRAVYEEEMANWGFSHAVISQAVLAAWKLPEPVQAAALHHHNPEADDPCGSLMPLSRAVKLADLAVNALGMPASGDAVEPQNVVDWLEQAGFNGKSEKIVSAFEKEMQAMAGVF
jgi:HD-like signal output (HDOD) protein